MTYKEALELTQGIIADGQSNPAFLSEDCLETIAQALEQAESVRHGFWIQYADGTICSECGQSPCEIEGMRVANYSKPYCPNCGATMDEVTE